MISEQLLEVIKNDLSIFPYEGESETSLKERILYSALGFWFLNLCFSQDKAVPRSTVTKKIKSLSEEYSLSSCIDICDKFFDIYSKIGYIRLNDEGVILENLSYSIDLNGYYLSFFVPSKDRFFSGLGILSFNAPGEVYQLDDLFMRGNLSLESIIADEYDYLNFDDGEYLAEAKLSREKTISFFNPEDGMYQNTPKTKYSILRERDEREFSYKRVIFENNKIMVDTSNIKKDKGFLRLLHLQLRKYYIKSQEYIVIRDKGNGYNMITLNRELPESEQTFLNLIGWPIPIDTNEAKHYLIYKDILEAFVPCLEKIGLKINYKE